MQNFRGCGVCDFVGRESGPHPQETREVVLQLLVRGGGWQRKGSNQTARSCQSARGEEEHWRVGRVAGILVVEPIAKNTGERILETGGTKKGYGKLASWRI